MVRPGDTLSGIALRYGTTVDAIMRANGMTSTTIYVGQSLATTLGGDPAPGTRQPSFARHRARPAGPNPIRANTWCKRETLSRLQPASA